jgi:nucleoid-associated protein YgaU
MVFVALVGGGIGLSLGSRQGGPLVSRVEDSPRLEIVVPAPGSAPDLKAMPSPSPAPSPVFPSAVAGASPQPAAAATQYVVQSGDTLRSIARDQYDDAELWQAIYQANRSTIGPNPDALIAGKTLQIPTRH